MDIKELKEYVDAKIKENGRQEITGPVLNKVLNSAIDTLDDTASAEVAEAVAKLEGEVTAEATARESADNTLQSAIDSEARARESTDTAITSRVAKLEAIPIAKGAGEGSIVASNLANTASGKYAFAEGDSTRAEQRGSHAEGASTIASAIGAHAEGESTTASGRASHSEGYLSTASGKYAHAEGYLCSAIGEKSHAEGSISAAKGVCSHVEGVETIASASGAHAQGLYNEDDTNLIHSVGIGSAATRKNAEAIYTDGKKYVKGIGNYNGTKASIASGAKDVATVIGENNAHVASTNNPHKVTASQIGASTPAEVTSAIATHNTASDAHSDIREEVANCVKLNEEGEQTVEGSLAVSDTIRANTAEIAGITVDKYTEGVLRLNGGLSLSSATELELGVSVSAMSSAVRAIVLQLTTSDGNFDLTNVMEIDLKSLYYFIGEGSLSLLFKSDTRPEVEEAGETHALAYEDEVPHIVLLTKYTDIGDLKDAIIGSYVKDENTLIYGTLPDGVSKADRFRLEVLPLGDSYVEQRMTVPTNGTVAVYSRVWNGSSWGSWV